MADFDTQEYRAARFERDSAADQISGREFPIVMRGYDRAAVDAFVREVVQLVEDLETGGSHEAAVQRKLEEVGEETAGILQRAHETADEIAARSRAQADGRIQRAEREAELMRRQAEEYSEQVVADTRALWEERLALIEDIRQLADDVLSTADDAHERVALPGLLREEDGELEGTLDDDEEQPTGEVEFDVLPGGAMDDEPTTASDDPTTSNGLR